MYKIIIYSAIFFLFLGCNNQNEESADNSKNTQISEYEKSILDSLDFDSEILKQIRTYTDSVIHIRSLVSEIYYDSVSVFDKTVKDHRGFYFNAEENLARKIVLELKDKFRNKGYLIYISESNFGYDPDKISVIKSTDQFDILRLEETNGANYSIENEDVIDKLQEWNTKFPFEIIAADFDFVEAVFIKNPTDYIYDFSEEVYKFCPDVVDQGTGSVKELANQMRISGTLYLWWD